MVGLGAGTTANVLAVTVAARWFTKHRGLVTGVMLSATATGQLVFLPLLADDLGHRRLAHGVDHGGDMRAACMLPLVYCFMRDRPQDIGLAPYGETEVASRGRAEQGQSVGDAFAALREGLRSRDYMLLAASFFICGASTNGLIGTHLIPACIDAGIPEVAAASMLASMAIFNFIGTTGSGWLSDRFDNRVLLSIYYGLRGLSLIMLPFSFVSFYGLSLFVVFYGLDWFATVPPTVKITTRLFGREKAPIMFGWLMCSHQIGGASAAFFGRHHARGARHLHAGVHPVGVMCLAGAIIVLLIRLEAGAGRAQARGTGGMRTAAANSYRRAKLLTRAAVVARRYCLFLRVAAPPTPRADTVVRLRNGTGQKFRTTVSPAIFRFVPARCGL